MEKIHVKLNSKIEEIELKEDEVLLDQILESGIDYPHGCRAGSCGACRSILESKEDGLSKPSAVEGLTLDAIKKMGISETLTENESLRLPCRTKSSKTVSIRPLS